MSQTIVSTRTIRFLSCSYRQSFDARHAVYEIDVPEPEVHYVNVEEQPEGLYVNVNVNTT